MNKAAAISRDQDSFQSTLMGNETHNSWHFYN